MKFARSVQRYSSLAQSPSALRSSSGLSVARRRSSRWLPLASIAVLASALVSCTPSTESRLEEVRELQASNQMEQSIPILVELIESGNRQGEILYRYGRALSLTGQTERSVWALDAAREDPDWFVRASQQLAVDAQLAQNYDFALEVFKRLHEEAPESIDDDPFALLLEARVMLDTQTKFQEALELIDDVIERFPEEETAVRLKAVALLGLKRPDEAYELLRAAGVRPDEEDNKKEEGKGESDGEEAGEGEEAPDAAGGADSLVAGTGDESGADAKGQKKAADGADSDLYLEIEDEAREAYWCTVRASFKREAGEIDEASKIIDECLEKFPTAVDLMTEAVKLYSASGRFDRVLEILEKAYEKSPENREIQDAYVQLLGRIGRSKEVEGVLRKAIAEAEKKGRGQTVETAALWVDLAGFLMERDRIGEALIAFDKVNAIVGDDASPDLLLREAEALIRAKQFDEAVKMAEKTPVEVHKEMLRGRIAFEQGDYPKALERLAKAALLWPDNAPIRFYRARSAEGVGDFDLAVEEYRHAVRSDPTLSGARERLARLHLSEGNFREASSILTFQSPRKPSDPSTEMRILMVEVETMRGTEPDLDILPDPTHPTEKIRRDTILAMSRGLSHRAGPRAAAGVLAELEKESVPAIRGAFLRERVDLLSKLGDHGKAIEAARAGLKARPDDFDTRLALGRALAAEGKQDAEAEALLRKLAEERPNEIDVMTALAGIAARGGDRKAADALYERALVVEPGNWNALRPLVDDLVAEGKRDAALARLQAFLDRDAPYDGAAALALARLLPESEKTKRVALARRAIRFSTGKEGIDFLASIDPKAAEDYEIVEPEKPKAAKGDETGNAEKAEKAGDAVLPQASPQKDRKAAKG